MYIYIYARWCDSLFLLFLLFLPSFFLFHYSPSLTLSLSFHLVFVFTPPIVLIYTLTRVHLGGTSFRVLCTDL